MRNSSRLSGRWTTHIRILLFLVAVLGAQGCASVPVWERVKLSDYLMREDRDPLAGSLAEHVYFTREAAAGSGNVGGGGCGCN